MIALSAVPHLARYAVVSLTIATILSVGSARADNAADLLYQGPDREQKLIDGAKREGQVVIYSAMIVNQALRPIAEKFSKKYPFLKLTYWRADSEDIMQKISAEVRANNVVADIVEGTGVGELAAQQRQRGRERSELGVGELDRGEVEVLRPQGVVLLLGDAVDRLLDGQWDAQRLELGAVRVETPRERVLVHAAVALDVPFDVERCDRPALGHQIRNQRELADQLLGVLRHPLANDRDRVC